MCVAGYNRENFTQTNVSVSSSSMLVLPERSSAVLVMISSKSVSICKHSQARRANSGKILQGYQSLMHWFEGNLLTQRHKICSHETRACRLSYGENPESLSRLGFNRYQVMTDRQTELR